MRRREFIGLAVSMAAFTRPAQAEGKIPIIGFLGPAEAAIAAHRISAFESRLRELGRVPGKTCLIEYRWGNGQTARFAELAAELLELKVDVIVTWGGATAAAVKKAASDTPIVFTIVGDPVHMGIVSSLAHPEGNATGISTQHPESVGKRIQVLLEALPNVRRLGVLVNVLGPGDMLELEEVKSIASKSDIVLVVEFVRTAEEIDGSIRRLRSNTDALYIVSDALFNNSRKLIGEVALALRLPTISGFKDIVAAGVLMSYGPEYLALFRRAADLVDKILRGEKPRDIPVEQPVRYELVLNLHTAGALNLTLPSTLLARADEVIE
jgi:putative ABC transport system substrate-binding protein